MVGERAAQLLAARFGTMERLLAATEGDINDIYGIGPQIAQAVTTFLAEPRNRATIERLAAAGVAMSEAGHTEGPRPLAGKSLALTGGLASLTPDQAKDLVLRLRGRVTGSVSKKRDEVVRTLAEPSVWQVGGRSGDTEADELLQVGIEEMNRGDGPAAVETFTKAIQRKPDFAEAWNKRATVYFLMGEHEKSLKDCDEVMKRNPAHFGALAGYGQIYLQLDQPERALTYFRRSIRVNPNMRSVEQIIPQLEQLLTERRKGTI